jgi:hypothetical protein
LRNRRAHRDRKTEQAGKKSQKLAWQWKDGAFHPAYDTSCMAAEKLPHGAL